MAFDAKIEAVSGVIVIGAGLAGLSCARELQQAGISYQLFEASDDIGGRVRTDNIDGFILDRGFQVLLTAYPEAKQKLDYEVLNFRCFTPGALIRVDNRFQRLADPWRQPGHLFATLSADICSLSDRVKLLALRSRLRRLEDQAVFLRPEQTILTTLREIGFSERFIKFFFKPFFGGITLDSSLTSSSRMFEFVFQAMALGETVVPAAGMQAIPRQIAEGLEPQRIRLRAPVKAIHENKVILENGQIHEADDIVIATAGHDAQRLIKLKPVTTQNVTCIYFAAETSPVGEPTLVLNGDEPGPVNNLAVMTDVAPEYGPADQALISVSVLGTSATADRNLEQAVRNQLSNWYGGPVNSWRHLRTYRIAEALPNQTPPALSVAQRPVRLRRGLYICGDHRDNASINGAMESGRRAAEAILEDRRTNS